MMWIDAISINQNDLAERAEQVGFMARIYSYSSRVIVWLGEEADHSTELFATIETVAEKSQFPSTRESGCWSYPDSSYFQLVEQDPRPSPYPGCQCCADVVISRTSSYLDQNECPLHQSLDALLARSWFQRMWVLQEAVAVQHVTMVCGQAEMSGSTFARGLSHLRPVVALKDHSRRLTAIFTKLLSWHNATNRTSTVNSLVAQKNSVLMHISPLAELLDKFHEQQATDRRDKV